MDIKIISVNAMSEGAEILLTVAISEGGRAEKRKLLIFTEQYLELGLSKGALLDEESFDRLEKISKQCKAIKKGSDLLSYSASSERRLAQRLKGKGIDRESAEFAASKLKAMGAINEKIDVERALNAYLKKLWGKKRIYKELCAKGYERECIISALDEVDGEVFEENCALLLKKKYKILPSDPAEQKKIIAALIRYGYSFSEIKKAMQTK